MSTDVSEAKDDVHRLLALGSVADIPSPGSRRTDDPLLENSFLPPAMNDLSPGIDKRTAATLDAIAAIAVREPRGEVIAVGAQIQHSPAIEKHQGNFTLVIASNTKVPDDTIDHLRAVWFRLEKLAQLHHKSRPLGSEYRRLDFVGTSPPSPLDIDTEVAKEHSQMVRDIYRHNFPKFLRRLNKSYVTTMHFFVDWKIKLYPTLGKDNSSKGPLLGFIAKLRDLKNKIQDLTDTDEDPVKVIEDPKFVRTMDLIWKHYRELEQVGFDEVSLWGFKFNAPPLDRYFRKVTLLHSAISKLGRFSRSPRMYRLFAKKLTIIALSGPSQLVKLPTKENDWEQVFQNALSTGGFAFVSSPIEIINSAMKQFPRCQMSCRVHCECLILWHFSRMPKVKPVNYIGVSKLSCAGCSAVFEAYNTYRTTKYYTRGSHGKWYFPWLMPAYSNEFTEMVYGVLAKKLGECMTQKGFARVRSASDCPALSSDSIDAPVAEDEDDNDYVEQLLKLDLKHEDIE
ncbi:hypothetical protein BDD12DRAFT_823914 [Trichophaea hybrida]|nr:hypothetical protein BDD12DRAFT_823914 [Trichophaea hybrida]